MFLLCLVAAQSFKLLAVKKQTSGPKLTARHCGQDYLVLGKLLYVMW